ncbi:flavin reductase family protein [Cobetia amphilecti]|uniref:flavin reductase family protein n=1 Tax=Cobetia amphilecti TaxID=1055104 RepID=UPI00349F989E
MARHRLADLPPPLGNPVINDSLHWLDCKIHAEHPVGDHLIVIGEVKGLNLDISATARPLLYFKGKYGGRTEEE